MNHVLWLTSWYPSRVDEFNGDFIERQAIAVSRFINITLLLVIKDESMPEREVEVERSVNGNLVVYKVYYGISKLGGIVERILSFKKYLQLQKRLYRQIEKESGKPSLVHVHVAMKAGMLARWLKKRAGIPFIVTEHWTGYYPGSPNNIYEANWLSRQLNKKVLQDCSLLIPVSVALGDTINEHFTACTYEAIPNVVDNDLFFYQSITPPCFRFIHVSSMNHQKNPEGILDACKIVKDKGYDFELIMIGHQEDHFLSMATEMQLTGIVHCQQVVPYSSIALEMQRSSAFILFSRFENLPCVVLEALCCGLPVISSRVGGIDEVINESNGVLVENENVTELATAMMSIIKNYTQYDRPAIASAAVVNYSYRTIGKRCVEIYSRFG